VRRGIRGALVRGAGWALLASLTCLVVALLVGIGGFEHTGRPGRVAPRRAVLEGGRTGELADAGKPASAWSAAEPLASHARIARGGLLRGTPLTASDAVQSQPRTLSVTAAASAPASAVAAPAVLIGERVQATLSYYYCAVGPSGIGIGDGGGFCGTMRDGERVFPGAAACSPRYLGQRFTIAGDPSGTVYTCTDTGSAVAGMHRDIWFDTSDAGAAWLRRVGRVATILIVP
jgi:hypothetical protein